eukprot:scaffold8028_cov165-Amphora_coffeaeformis.AAC.9
MRTAALYPPTRPSSTTDPEICILHNDHDEVFSIFPCGYTGGSIMGVVISHHGTSLCFGCPPSRSRGWRQQPCEDADNDPPHGQTDHCQTNGFGQGAGKKIGSGDF